MCISTFVSGRYCFLRGIHHLCSYTFSAYSRCLSCEGAGLIKTSHLRLNASLSVHCLAVGSMLINNLCKKLWWRLSDALTHGYNSMLLAFILLLCLFGKIVIVGFPLGFRFLATLTIPGISYISESETKIHPKSGWFFSQCFCQYCTNISCRQVAVVTIGVCSWMRLMIICLLLWPIYTSQ